MDEDRIAGTAKELGGKAEGAVGRAAGDDRTRVEGEAAERDGSAQDLYGRAKETLGDAAGRAKDLAGGALEGARDHYPDVGRAYRQGGEALRSHAKDSPLGLTLMAGAIGYLLALAVHGRR